MSKQPEWMRERLIDLVMEHGSYKSAAYALIEAHEEPPADPLLLEAREICAKRYEGTGTLSSVWSANCRRGVHDSTDEVQCALLALRRGMELERGKSQ